jgi:hypothetical protein
MKNQGNHMTRKAILIESSNVKGQTDLPGARIDVENWKSFLKSDLGGAWSDSEIVTLSKPWSSQVEEALKVSTDCYCFVAFSGHGRNGSVVLNDHNDSFSVSSFKPKANRATLIVDACRGVADAVALLANLKVAMVNESIIKAVAVEALQGRSTVFCNAPDEYLMNRLLSTSNHRAEWEKSLNAASGGTVEMLACSKGQAAGENPSAGGYYTSLLMQSAELWNKRIIKALIHSTKDAHDYAASKLPVQQTPEYTPSSLAFPFAVRL